MGMTDPIADMLTRIRNASRARHPKVAVPWSRVKENITKVLVDEGYIKEYKKTKAVEGAGEDLIIQLKYDKEKQPIILGLKRISSPSRRVYVGAQEIPLVRKGLGINVLSTAKGILADREAQREKVGGEIICSVW
jgi:small subunit ribosomal protein S8